MVVRRLATMLSRGTLRVAELEWRDGATDLARTSSSSQGVRAGDRRALARAISLVENRGTDGATRSCEELYPADGHGLRDRRHRAARRRQVGADRCARAPRPLARTLGRRRLGRPLEPVHAGRAPRRPDPPRRPLPRPRRLHPLDGHPRALGRPRRGDAAGLLLLDAAGKDVVFLETVGTGQRRGGGDRRSPTRCVLVLMPGSGDSVQALKAGIMEIPDVIAINKMDQPGAKAMLADIRRVLSLAPAPERPPVVLTESLRGEGVAELWRRSSSAATSSRPRASSRSGGAGTSRGEVVSPRRPACRDADRARPWPRTRGRRARRGRRAARARPAHRRRPDRLVGARQRPCREQAEPRRPQGRARAAGGHRAGDARPAVRDDRAAVRADRCRSRPRTSS